MAIEEIKIDAARNKFKKAAWCGAAAVAFAVSTGVLYLSGAPIFVTAGLGILTALTTGTIKHGRSNRFLMAST